MASIQSIMVHSSLHHEEYISHEKVYEGYVSFVQKLNRKGWKQYFFMSSARIVKENNWKHIQEHMWHVIDPATIFSFERWKGLDRLVFRLQLGEVCVGITLMQTFSDKDKKPHVD